jgi:hypothetical protein
MANLRLQYLMCSMELSQSEWIEESASILDNILSPQTTISLPAAPNFFLEAKSARGRLGVAKRHACHDGATPGVGRATSLNCARGSSDERWMCGVREWGKVGSEESLNRELLRKATGGEGSAYTHWTGQIAVQRVLHKITVE